MVRDDNNEKSSCLCPFLTVLKSLFIWSFLRPRLQGSADIFERPKCHGKFFTWSKVGLKFWPLYGSNATENRVNNWEVCKFLHSFRDKSL